MIRCLCRTCPWQTVPSRDHSQHYPNVPHAVCVFLLTCVQLADEHWGVIGVKFKQTSCDKLGPIDGSDNSSDNNKGETDNGSQDNNSSQDNSSQDNSSQKDSQDLLKEFKGWDKSWIKQRVSNWDHLKDDEFEKHWEDLTSDARASKFKHEKPSWVK